MRRLHTRWIVAVAALMASGCLLPQPDTPWVPPGALPTSAEAGRAEDASMSAPAAAPQATALPDPGPTGRPWVQLSGRVVGIEATSIAAVHESGFRVVHPFGADGEFVLAIPYRSTNQYWLELTTARGVLRLEPPIVVTGPEPRRITIRVEGDRITLEEEAKLTPAASPTPSPSPSPSPGGGNTATTVIQ